MPTTKSTNDSSKTKTTPRKVSRASFTGLSLYVRNVSRSVEYYSKIPGASVLINTPDFAMLKIGTKSRLGLIKSRNARKGFHLEFVSDDLDTLYSIMSSASNRRISQPAKRAWGERSFTAMDPDGYEVEFEDGGGRS